MIAPRHRLQEYRQYGTEQCLWAMAAADVWNQGVAENCIGFFREVARDAKALSFTKASHTYQVWNSCHQILMFLHVALYRYIICMMRVGGLTCPEAWGRILEGHCGESPQSIET